MSDAAQYVKQCLVLDLVRLYAHGLCPAPEVPGLFGKARKCWRGRKGPAIAAEWVGAMQPAFELVDRFRAELCQGSRVVPADELRDAIDGTSYTTGSLRRFIEQKAKIS